MAYSISSKMIYDDQINAGTGGVSIPQMDLPSSSDSEIITVIISILVFAIGIFISWSFDRYKKKKELELYKLLIVEWTKCFKPSVDAFINHLDTFANELIKNSSLNIPKYVFVTLNFDKINSLPLDKLIDALVVNISTKIDKKIAVNSSYNLLNQLYFLEIIVKDIQKTYDNYCIENRKIMDEWNEHFMSLSEQLSQTSSDKSLDALECQYYEKIWNELKPFILVQHEKIRNGEDPDYSISEFKEKFIIPAYEYNTNPVFAKSSKISKTILTISMLRNTILKHEKINEFGFVFKERSESMKFSWDSVYSSVLFYEKQAITKFWDIK